MRKILFSLITLLMTSMLGIAADVDLQTAQSTAQQFLRSNSSGTIKAGSPAANLRLLHAELNSTQVDKAVYYIFNSEQGFVIVSGDDRAQSILAFGDQPIDMKDMPENMKFWLMSYKEQIEYLQAHPGMVVKQTNLNNQLNTPNISPLLTAEWSQQEPYYNHCPVYNDRFCVTGCPATSLSMVFYYWKYPTDPTPEVEGYMNPSSNYQFEIPALPSITFDWANMRDNYTGSYTDAQADAVAWLMRYVGQAEQLQYSPSGSGTSDAINILHGVRFFGYDKDAQLVYRTVNGDFSSDSIVNYTNDEWDALLQNELANGRPVVYCAWHREWIGLFGHAFNIDGYKASNNTYHVNWGWNGKYNGYFALNAMNIEDHHFNVEHHMIIGIQPPVTGPAIRVYPPVVTMSTLIGQPTTGTFTVKGQELTGDVELTLNDPTGYFSIDATHVANSDLENGKAINLTFTPQAHGTHTATITLSSPGAQDKTYTVTGFSYFETQKPFLLPPDNSHINLTKFRADWTDETESQFVESYSLKVYPWAEVEEIDSINANLCPDAYQGDVKLTEPWSGMAVSLGGGFVYFGRPFWGIGYDGYINYTVPEGYTNQLFTVQVTTGNSNMSDGNLIVASDQTEGVGHEFVQKETYTWFVTASSGENIYFTSSDLGHSPYMTRIAIYAGDVTTANGNISTGNNITRLINGITDKFCDVNNLPEGGSYYYRVKATYVDGSQSLWSNSRKVTLFDQHGYDPGDVNHDGNVGISDVSAMIDRILSGNGGCDICADIDNNGIIDIADLSALIDLILSKH